MICGQPTENIVSTTESPDDLKWKYGLKFAFNKEFISLKMLSEI